MELRRIYAYSLPTMKKIILIILLAGFLASSAALATADETPANLPIPRFVTLGTDEVNVRSGPGIRYPISFVLNKDALPVEVVKEFDVWRQIKTLEGDEGWVHKSLLSGKRSVIIKGTIQTLFQEPNVNTKPVVKLEPGVIATLDKCENNWCNLSVASYSGWIKRDDIWGVYPDELFVK
jgi:SH3-like domain-containing protein